MTLVIRDAYLSSMINLIAIAALTAVSLRFVILMGEVNFATAAVVGIGAYTAGAAITILGLPFLVALLLGGVVAGLVSIAFGYMTLRIVGILCRAGLLRRGGY